MKIDVLTLFPELFEVGLRTSILGRATALGILNVSLVNFRDFSTDKHHTVDDYPFGGGAGMVLKPEPIFRAVESILLEDSHGHVTGSHSDTAYGSSVPDSVSAPCVILLSPQGQVFNQSVARELAQSSRLILICGHYEGFDERIREHLVTHEISIGDYVLTGGELAAMVVIDAVARLLPGVLGNNESAEVDSFSDGLLEYPQYTRPCDFRGWKVPTVLMSGHHTNVKLWRRRQSILRTLVRRPDLLKLANLTADEVRYVEELRALGMDNANSQLNTQLDEN